MSVQICTVEAEGSLFLKNDRKESQHIFQGDSLILESSGNEGSKVLKAKSEKKDEGTVNSVITGFLGPLNLQNTEGVTKKKQTSLG